MRRWRNFFIAIFSALLALLPFCQSYRHQGPCLGYRKSFSGVPCVHASHDGSLASSPEASVPSTEYIFLEEPIRAVWSPISEYLVPLCYPGNKEKSPKALPIVLGCSGGVDSMSLLHALGIIKQHAAVFVGYSPWKRILGSDADVDQRLLYATLRTILDNIRVVYFDHKVRDDTDRDIEIVSVTCERYGFHLTVKHAQEELTEIGSQKAPGNFQQCAREWRLSSYKDMIERMETCQAALPQDEACNEKFISTRIFNHHALRQSTDSSIDNEIYKNYFHEDVKGIVLLAHHANDNVETFLFKILRGVHLSNMAGIEPVTNMDGDKNILIIRPFLHMSKEELRSFLERVGGTYQEDSSNAKPVYVRNRIRNKIIPEVLNAMFPEEKEKTGIRSLDKRCRTLASQSSALKCSIDLESYMFHQYVSSKYQVPNPADVPEYGIKIPAKTVAPSVAQLSKIYTEFYRSIYDAIYGNKESEKTQKTMRTVRFLRDIGFNIKELFFVKEWLLVTSDVVRKDILHSFCVRSMGDDAFLDHGTLESLSNTFSKEPVSDKMKQYCLRKDAILCHQGSICKQRRQSFAKSSGTVIYDDGYCSFRVSPNFKATVTEFQGDPEDRTFYLRLSLPCDGKSSAYDIRQLKEGDVVPSDALWNRNASSVLSKMSFPQVLIDEIPVIALRGSNQVVCFYGLNTNAPYYVTAPQYARVSFGKQANHAGEYRDYRLVVVGK